MCLEEIHWWDNWDGKWDPYEASWNNNREFMNSFLRRVMQVNIRASCVLRRARKQGPYCHRSSPTRSLLYQSTPWPAGWLINTLVLSVKRLMCDQQLPQQGIWTPQFPHAPAWSSEVLNGKLSNWIKCCRNPRNDNNVNESVHRNNKSLLWNLWKCLKVYTMYK